MRRRKGWLEGAEDEEDEEEEELASVEMVEMMEDLEDVNVRDNGRGLLSLSGRPSDGVGEKVFQ